MFLEDYTILEQLPNELFFSIFNFLEASNLYDAFWGLNSRFNNLVQSCENLSVTLHENTDSSTMKLYASEVVGLTVDTSNGCDFSQFPNLRDLTLYNRNVKHLTQIKPKIIPNLTHVSFLLESDFIPSSELIRDIFSNRFPYLRYANLGCVDGLNPYLWSTSSSLRFVSIYSNQPVKIISIILTSCPNLYHLRLLVLPTSSVSFVAPSPSNHSLQRLTLWSDNVILNFKTVDTLLTYTPNVQHLYLQTMYRTPFVYLADCLLNRLHHLSRFDCYVKEFMDSGNRVGDLAIIHQLHPCFNRIQCISETDTFRIFATK